MGKIMIFNGSPRAPKSNSKEYARIFAQNCRQDTEYFEITKDNHLQLASKLSGFSDLLLVFPLYVDSLPATLLNFLKTLEENPPANKPAISLLINCGFFEAWQNDTAVKMVRLFCRQNGYEFGSSLEIGSGEAILTTPFKSFAARKIRKLALAVDSGKHRALSVTMPIPKKMFVKASTGYWISYGSKNGVTKEQMETMEIEA